MDKIAAITFLLTALLGLTMLVLILKKRTVPWSISTIHALMGAASIVLLTIYIITDGGSVLDKVLLTLFVVTALGGFTLAYHHLKGLPYPVFVIVVHAFLAVSAYIGLVLKVFQIIA